MKILLNHDEVEFIERIFLSIPKDILFSKIVENNQQYVAIDLTNADKLRDFFIEMQQEIGFDQTYGLTKEGAILERLIDKFFA